MASLLFVCLQADFLVVPTRKAENGYSMLSKCVCCPIAATGSLYLMQSPFQVKERLGAHVQRLCVAVISGCMMYILPPLQINQSINQSINQPTNQPTNQPINQPQSINLNQAINQSINQPTNRPILFLFLVLGIIA